MKVIDYDAVIQQIYKQIKPSLSKGKLPTYIPALTEKGKGRHFGFSIKLIDGTEFSVGESTKKFSIQSISKVFALTLALQQKGEKVWKRLDKEPSGMSFNSLSQLENAQGFPKNPFLNSGALVIADMLLECIPKPKEAYLKLLKEASCNPHLKFNKTVVRSELEFGYRNRALINYLKECKSVTNDVDKILDLYVHFCSVDMSCVDLVRIFSYLANKGTCLTTNKPVLSASQTKRINALLMTCGTYNTVGDFAYRVGLPGKSGVGGGIIAVMPREFVICVWSPRLNESGNSLAGTRALELFTTKTQTSIF